MYKAITQQYILECTLTDCPEDVKASVQTIWNELELSNNEYFYWDRVEEYDLGENIVTYAEAFPIIDEFLLLNNISECLINYWW